MATFANSDPVYHLKHQPRPEPHAINGESATITTVVEANPGITLMGLGRKMPHMHLSALVGSVAAAYRLGWIQFDIVGGEHVYRSAT
jgi:hypothetical protein